MEHETDCVWCKIKGDGCTQTLCRQGYERAMLPRICCLLCCSLHRCSHTFLHVDSKSSISFKNDVIVCVVRIRKENFQCASNEAKLFPSALKGLLMKSMTKFRQDFIASFFLSFKLNYTQESEIQEHETYWSIAVFIHHCKTLTKLALKNVLTIYREAKGKKKKKKEDACWAVGFFWLVFFWQTLFESSQTPFCFWKAN